MGILCSALFYISFLACFCNRRLSQPPALPNAFGGLYQNMLDIFLFCGSGWHILISSAQVILPLTAGPRFKLAPEFFRPFPNPFLPTPQNATGLSLPAPALGHPLLSEAFIPFIGEWCLKSSIFSHGRALPLRCHRFWVLSEDRART